MSLLGRLRNGHSLPLGVPTILPFDAHTTSDGYVATTLSMADLRAAVKKNYFVTLSADVTVADDYTADNGQTGPAHQTYTESASGSGTLTWVIYGGGEKLFGYPNNLKTAYSAPGNTVIFFASPFLNADATSTPDPINFTLTTTITNGSDPTQTTTQTTTQQQSISADGGGDFILGLGARRTVNAAWGRSGATLALDNTLQGNDGTVAMSLQIYTGSADSNIYLVPAGTQPSTTFTATLFGFPLSILATGYQSTAPRAPFTPVTQSGSARVTINNVSLTVAEDTEG